MFEDCGMTDPLDVAGRVLAKASLYDPTFSRPDAAMAAAWAQAIGWADPDDAVAAVDDFYTRETKRVMPADIIAGVRRIRADRVSREWDFVPDADPDNPREFIAALRAGVARIADGSERPRPVRQLIAGTAKGIPA